MHNGSTKYDTVRPDTNGYGPGVTTRHPLGDLMNRVVASDPAAIGEFVELARPKVRCIQRRALGAKGITVGREQLDDMAGDGVVELLRLAPGWSAWPPRFAAMRRLFR